MVNKLKGDVLMTASELETKKVAPLFFFKFYFQWNKLAIL